MVLVWNVKDKVVNLPSTTPHMKLVVFVAASSNELQSFSAIVATS